MYFAFRNARTARHCGNRKRHYVDELICWQNQLHLAHEFIHDFWNLLGVVNADDKHLSGFDVSLDEALRQVSFAYARHLR